jgi:hypothetical protein
MNEKELVISEIQAAFINNEFPGDSYLLGSYEGSEPFDEIDPFKGQENWRHIPSQVLDSHAKGISFFSEAGLRFFLPAYLIADLKDELDSADPMFILVHGFSNRSVEHRIGDQVFIRKTGKNSFVNPRRYGGMTFYDYSLYRLSIFTREESQAIVSYLNYKKKQSPLKLEKEGIEAALNLFWHDRVLHAPKQVSLDQFILDEEHYLDVISNQRDGNS